jgi:hypothetical protein
MVTASTPGSSSASVGEVSARGTSKRRARAAGLDDGEVARVPGGAGAEGWAAHEAALLRAADELHAGCSIADATWDVLAAHYEMPALIEVPFVIGQYTMLSMVANGLDVEAEPGSDPLPG